MYLFWNILSLAIAVASIVYAVNLFQQIMRKDPGDAKMQKIAEAVQQGGRAFLHAEYKWLAVFVTVVFFALCLGSDDGKTQFLGWKTAVAFVMGAVASAGAGYFGMHCATRAAVRTTQAAKTSLGAALDIAFKSGTVMGMTVVGLGLLGITLLMVVYQTELVAGPTAVNFVNYVLGFSFGASSIALFARVGGGIYTKAADVGGDLVGKVEAGIPEDDPRNPAVIADNVGDNVGDVAGMGADLFESYVGAIISTAIIGWALVPGAGGDATLYERNASSLLLYPIVLSAVGIVASFLGTFRVKADDESKLSSALFGGLIAASVFLVIGGALITAIMQPTPLMTIGGTATATHWAVYGAMVVGLVVGVIIGKVTEYYTSEKMAPAQMIAQQSKTGAATNIIYGLATGMASTWIPTILLALAIYICNDWAGMYGICVAAVGMLSTLGISLGVDAYGPVADNAGGLAEMSHQPPEVRKRTDSLDATGNTTAAIGKGFAIGSAALTALALFAAYKVAAGANVNLSLDNADVVMGLLVGGMLPFVFSSMAMKAVGKAANAMVEEVRRQFREIPGLKDGTGGEADYARCVAISTEGALREMVVPGLLAIVAPLLMGMIFGKSAVGGMLAGSTAGGVMMALFMANAGGAWDNAKKYIEAGHLGGKGSDTHKAAVTGDTVGDPFKDTAGPSINILMKLMTIAALIALPLFKNV
ncbi:MAG: sodium-translocating pyrophosphatase [Planctomycetes bacterium]|jgi:K(+)-stimulated pyrophosphate-energized sodium pump|nr:sodium-translocating pyrophosphatase [Planctomycetota bacterium]